MKYLFPAGIIFVSLIFMVAIVFRKPRSTSPSYFQLAERITIATERTAAAAERTAAATESLAKQRNTK